MWCRYNVKYVSDWRCNVNVRQADKQTQVCRNMHSVHSFTANVDLSHTLYISTSTFAQNYIRAADLQPLFTLYNLLLSANSLLNISLFVVKTKERFLIKLHLYLISFSGVSVLWLLSAKKLWTKCARFIFTRSTTKWWVQHFCLKQHFKCKCLLTLFLEKRCS